MMSRPSFRESWVAWLRPSLATILVVSLAGETVAAETPAKNDPPVAASHRFPELNKRAPADVADLRAIESQVLKIVERLKQSTVGIIVGDAQGSGVIVTEDGCVLTAAHVVGAPGRKVMLVLADGRRVNGQTLGLNSASDTALIRITDRGSYPACAISDMKSLQTGDWCLATGHPGGHQSGRPPVVRIGRIVAMRQAFLQTDCPLLGGDSGGPLFDLDGHVIGIHSRIGPRTSLNLHVSASLYLRDWHRLSKGTDFDHLPAGARGMLGVNGEDDPKGARLTAIFPGLPAQDAGLKTGDVVFVVSGRPVNDFGSFQKFIQARRPGEVINLSIYRGGAVREFRATIVARPAE